MKIETIEVAGIKSALIAQRNPMDSWEKADSLFTTQMNAHCVDVVTDWQVGKADEDLSLRLQKSGPEHCKHLRMIQVWADITAPRYWWTEFDTYRNGVEKVSCSTMHKLMSRELTFDDFEHDELNRDTFQEDVIDGLNRCIKAYKEEKNPDEKAGLFRGCVQFLPQSFLQKRTVMMSYAALRNIYRQREGHKLREWQLFRQWVEMLPESWMITE